MGKIQAFAIFKLFTVFVEVFFLVTLYFWVERLLVFVGISLTLPSISPGVLVLLSASNWPLLSLYISYKRYFSSAERSAWPRTLTLSIMSFIIFSVYLLAGVLAVHA